MSGCKILFMAASIGPKDLSDHMSLMCNSLTDLRRLVLFSGDFQSRSGSEVVQYNAFVFNGNSIFMNDARLRRAEVGVQASDVLNVQFTSGLYWYPQFITADIVKERLGLQKQQCLPTCEPFPVIQRRLQLIALPVT
jgi:hypothetical protein